VNEEIDMKMRGVCVALALTLGTLFGSLAARAEGDPERGKRVYTMCQACHAIGPNAPNQYGPRLHGIIGRRAGTVQGFPYTDLNRVAGENGLVWTQENLPAYLADPTAFLKQFLIDAGKPELAQGKSSMVFKVNQKSSRKNIAAFLAVYAKAQ
jgi:cytochrome c